MKENICDITNKLDEMEQEINAPDGWGLVELNVAEKLIASLRRAMEYIPEINYGGAEVRRDIAKILEVK